MCIRKLPKLQHSEKIINYKLRYLPCFDTYHRAKNLPYTDYILAISLYLTLFIGEVRYTLLIGCAQQVFNLFAHTAPGPYHGVGSIDAGHARQGHRVHGGQVPHPDIRQAPP